MCEIEFSSWAADCAVQSLQSKDDKVDLLELDFSTHLAKSVVRRVTLDSVSEPPLMEQGAVTVVARWL